MPNGDDKNWVRICLAVDGFRARYGGWPKGVRLPPTYFENVVGHVLNPIGFALVSSVFTIIPDDELSERVAIIAVGESGAEFQYGEESNGGRVPEPLTSDYFGPAVLREGLGWGFEYVTLHDAEGNLVWAGKDTQDAMTRVDAEQKPLETQSIFDEILAITANLSSVRPRDRTKLTGALAIEVIRNRLLQSGLPVSPRDVFIKGDPTEFDLLIVRRTAKPVCGIIFDPHDVAAALEIKFSGVYSQSVPTDLKELFDRIKSTYSHIHCMYLTVCENPKFKYRMTSEALGSRAFTLNWWVDYRKTGVKPG
jgi:hypothetical protein